MTGGLLAGSLVVGAVGVSGVAAAAGDTDRPIIDAASDRVARPDGRIADGPGTGRHPVVQVPCDAEKLVAALVKANAEGGGSLRLAPKCKYTLTQAFAQPDDYDGGIRDAREAADAAENAGGAAATPGAVAESPAAVAESPAVVAESPGPLAASPAAVAESPAVVAESPAAVAESPGAAAETPGAVAETPGDAEAPPRNLADDKAGLPVIYQPIIIDGAGAIIERDKQAEEFRFFTVRDGGELFLRDVELRNGRSKLEGGAIHIVHGATAVVERVTFTSNTSLSKDGGGGGIFNDGNLVASDLRLVGNNAAGAEGKGGGLLNGGVLTLRDSEFRRNSANAYGGGLGNYRGAADVEGTTFTQNSAVQGGGIASFSARTKVLDTEVLGNTAKIGGGIANSDAVIVLREMTIRDNISTVKGGGISTTQGLLPLDDSVVAGNTSHGHGGGIFAEKSNLLVRGSDVTDNEAAGVTSKGGGIYGTAGQVSIYTSTVVGNNATGQPGGLFIERAQVRIDDESVITGNEQTNCVGSTTPVANCFR
nr:hypothetical protein [Micromonospora avicenniae]